MLAHGDWRLYDATARTNRPKSPRRQMFNIEIVICSCTSAVSLAVNIGS